MSYDALASCVIDGDEDGAVAEVRRLLAAGADPLEILDEGLTPAMGVVGERFSAGIYYVPEMLLSASCMKSCLAILEPLLADAATGSAGTVVIGTVKGDLHDIGKNIVAIMLRGAGFAVHDLGVDVAPERFAAAARELRAEIVGLSCLLTTTRPMMGEVVAALESAGLRQGVKVLVGGAPVTGEFALAIGADAFAPDAGAAARVARALVATPTG